MTSNYVRVYFEKTIAGIVTKIQSPLNTLFVRQFSIRKCGRWFKYVNYWARKKMSALLKKHYVNNLNYDYNTWSNIGK